MFRSPHSGPARRGLALLTFAALLVASVAFGQRRSSGVSTIGVDEIRPGMRGHGLTVFRGTTPERFDVEVIDVLHNFRPDQDLILIRTEHPILDHATVVAGMSGSPIYLDGRLAGAYAYGWPFGRDPVAGVTPIRNMLNELRRPVRPDSFPGARPIPERSARRASPSRPRAFRAGLPPYLGAEPATATSALEAHAARLGIRRGPREPVAALQPAATPLLIGGLGDGAVSQLREQLEGFGLMVLQAGGGGRAAAAPDAPSRFTDGSAVGVQLIRGDVSATATGTVTHVEGQRLIGFGHPMLNVGESGLPTAVSRVLHILASEQRSFKISEPVRSLGTLIHDRQSAIVVDSSLAAATVPVRVRIEGVAGAERTEWNAEVASHRVLTPVLIGAVLSGALGASVSDVTDISFEAVSRVQVTGRSPLELVDRGESLGGITGGLGQLRLFSMIAAAYGNPFEEARIESVDVTLRLRFEREALEIVDASIAQPEVDPGATVPVRVVLRAFDQAEEVRIVRVRVPPRLAGQTVQLLVESGSVAGRELPEPRNLDDILEGVRTSYPRTSLVVSFVTPGRGMQFGGHVARALPPSALDSLQLLHDADRNTPFVDHVRLEVPVERVVSGRARLSLTVRSAPRPNP